MELKINSIADLDAVAKQFVATLKQQKVIAFSGEMGAGKTTFIKAICKELGSIDAAASPTFSLVNEYHTHAGNKLYHFDFYRINKPSEALDMGCEEYFYSGNHCFIEWPEKITELLPPDTLHAQISIDGDSRQITYSI